MKKIYLDANAYANIISKSGDKELILQKKETGAIAIFFTLENLEEMAGLYKKVPSKAKELFALSYGICSHKAPWPWDKLLKAELTHLNDSSVRIDLYSNKQDYQNEFNSLWQECAKGNLPTSINIDSTCKHKKDFNNSLQNLFKRRRKKEKRRRRRKVVGC